VSDGVTVAAAQPAPDELELVAIAAAVQVLWPRPMAVSTAPSGPGAWRFSGRWWAEPPHDGGWGRHRR
jgi:hypothetical protein